ncbi:MAG TPA: hypothetical protein DCE80_16660 [Ignavibacteriales bacterium]|nr:hypothetical protein [Ignavibacteriales bacterium]
MKRDLDLVRKILLAIEAMVNGRVDCDIEIPGFTKDQIGYHVFLMGQAGLLKVVDITDLDSKSPQAAPIHLTWAGHEFLDASKDEGLWSKAKSKVIKPAGGVAFDVLLEWLKAEVKQRIGL